MLRRSLTKVAILFTIFVGVFFSFTISNAEQEFPRIAFLDAYFVHYGWGGDSTNFGDYDYYWPQMDSCGFTHIVTRGDSTFLAEFGALGLDPLFLHNDFLLNAYPANYNNRCYATGIANEYPVGGPYPTVSYFQLGETGEDIQDGVGGPLVFRMLSGTDSAGVVLSSSFAAGDQPWGGNMWLRDYWFIFTMKMVGDTSVSDSVARIYIWEEPAESAVYEGEHKWFWWNELWGGSAKDTSDTTIIIYYHDFSDTGAYENIELGSIDLAARGLETHITFEWLGHHDLYIDDLWVRDEANYDVFVAEYSDSIRNSIKTTLADWDAIIPGLHHRWYVDEPHRNMYHSFATVDSLAQEATEIPLNGCTGGHKESILRDFATIINPDELFYDKYPLKSHFDTTSSGDFNLQDAWEYVISYDSTGLRWASRVAKDYNKPFWMAIQTSRQSFLHSSGEVWYYYRAPTRNEIFAQVNLALCYGAKGIGYYCYPTYLGENPDDPPDTTWGLVDLVDDEDELVWNLDGHRRYIRNYRWYAVQEINAKLDSLDDVLLSLNWQEAFVSHPDTISWRDTFVESLYSDRFVPDSTYIEIGIFKNGSTDYLMLVNRRCLSTETDTLTVILDTAKSDAYMLEDMYNQDVYGGDNGVFSGIVLAPGEGRLLKMIDSDATWSGTINVQSSITIPHGVQLTIDPGAEIKFAQNKKLQINGVLRAKGSTGRPLIYFIAIDTTKQWSGILFADSSDDALCIMKNCFIEYAASGIACNSASPDTIDNIFIRHCDYGIKCTDNSSPRISTATMWDGTVPIGIYCGSNSDPTIDAVWLDGYYALGSKGIQIVNSDPVIQGGSIWNFERGIDICGGNPDIRDVELKYNTECGIACNIEGECDPCSAYIAHNDIFFNQTGIKSVDASPTVYRNRIMDSDSVGVWCSGTDTPNLGVDATVDSGYNEICNDLWNVYSECSGTVKAENNWWGQTPPDTNKLYGSIDYIPYLFQSPDSIPPTRITDLTATLVDSCIALQWTAVSTDTTGKSDPVPFYFVYRDTIAGFFPEPSDSIAVETTTVYLDCAVVGDASVNYYYSVRAVDYGYNLSSASNQVGEFDKSLTEKGGDEPPWPLSK